MNTITLSAEVEQLSNVLRFVKRELQNTGCSQKTKAEILIVVEEVFVNIALYAYQQEKGTVTLCCSIEGDPPQAVIQFSDQGIPFNPLTQKEADITVPAEEREIGGLGILMIKRLMSEVDYSYQDKQNILTIRKALFTE